VASGTIPSSVGEALTDLEPGTFVAHKSWGGGKIASWNLAEEKVLINFHEKPKHPMKLEFAAKSLTPVSDDHIYAKLVKDPDGTIAMAKEDPVSFVRSVLGSNGDSMYLDTFDEFVKETFVPTKTYKSWWESAKKKLRANNSFVVPSKRSEPMELRAQSDSPAEAYLADFDAVRDLKSKAKVIATVIKEVDTLEKPETELAPLVLKANETINRGIKLQLAQALELLTTRNELQKAVPGLVTEDQPDLDKIIQTERDRLPDVLPKLQVAGQRAVYSSFKTAFPESWVEEMLALIPGAGPRGITEITKILIAEGKEKEILGFIRDGLQQRSLSQDMLAWACRERAGVTADVFGPELGNAMLNGLEQGHYDDETPTNNRLRDLLINDGELIPDLVRDADVGYVKTLTRRLMMNPVFEELSRRSLLARVVKVHPDMESIVSGEADSDDEAKASGNLVVSWESLEARKNQLDDMINVKIPQNKKEINIAREHGDLRENAEYKAAKDQQAVLNRLRNELEAEIKSARGTDFSEVSTDKIGIGTIVDLKDTDSGAEQSFTILGAWDSDVDKGVIAYLTGTGDALIGNAVGDSVELPTEEAGVTHTVEVMAIRAYNA